MESGYVLRMNENDFIQDEQTNFCSHMSGVIHTCYSRLKDTCSWLFVKTKGILGPGNHGNIGSW